MIRETNLDQATVEAEHDVVEKLAHTIDEWRARADELLVQLDLAALNVHDEVHKRLEVAENVYLTARSPLAGARDDVSTNVNLVGRGMEQLVTDLRQACTAVDTVVRRSRSE
jgi:hypothetical protein